MKNSVTIRRVGTHEASACVEALSDVLIDCVEGGASVMLHAAYLTRKRTGVLAKGRG